MSHISARPASLPPISLPRRVTAHVAHLLILGLFLIALAPLASLVVTVVSRGWSRLDPTFFTSSMRGVVGAGGGALHAIVGTLLITLAAVVISAPIGIAAAVYLVEYGRGALARALTFLVDVMTGIPSIVAGLFAYAVLSALLGPGARSGLAGALALSVLMVPVVVRSSEEMLRLVPSDLREAALALGSPVYRTILRVVLPTAAPGLVSGVMLGMCRIVGETAPLLLVAGFTDSMNYDLADGRMATLPVFIYSQWQNAGRDHVAYENRAWTAALVLIAMVFAMNLAARLWSSRKVR
ncbi:MAG: phosphate ABC transporter permease PstA [Propionibacteriaceae bacterium]|nr:phosphate ABC transporter permease PstA [Propionibacteriaceae bacterium]